MVVWDLTNNWEKRKKRQRRKGKIYPSECRVPGNRKPSSVINAKKSVQFSSVAQLCPTRCNPMDCSTPGFPVHHQLPELAQTHVHSSRWCHPTISSSVIPFSSCLQSFPASGCFPVSQFFGSGGQSIAAELQHHSFRWIFRTDWFDLLAVQGTLKSLQHHSSKASILQRSASFMVQLSCPYMTSGKAIALTRQTFVDKVMSLLFNMLSRFVSFSSK